MLPTVTVEQLSALHKRVTTLNLPPYVDSALRLTKFRAWIPDGSGAYSFVDTVASGMAGFPNSVQLYNKHIEKLVKLYPSAWHLIVLADEKARGENWARLRLKITAARCGMLQGLGL